MIFVLDNLIEKDNVVHKYEVGIYIGSVKRNMPECEKVLYLIPRNIVIGIGCKKNTSYDAVSSYINRMLSDNSIFKGSVCAISSIDIKKEEQGIIELAKELSCPYAVYTADELNEVNAVVTPSEYVKQITGVDNVCERAALRHANNEELLVKKQADNGITFAAAVYREKKKKILIFAGTTEGRILTERLKSYNDLQLTVCSATEYGKELLPDADNNLILLSERMDDKAMYELMMHEKYDFVVDATHPYAEIVSENIKKASSKAEITYIRVKRPSLINNKIMSDNSDKIICVRTVDDAVDYLNKTEGNILSTIGSKELNKLLGIEKCTERVYARILPSQEMIKISSELGFSGQHLICMQGPFSEEMNRAMYNQFGIKYMLTKESGNNGGFEDKIKAAIDSNVVPVVIIRPEYESDIDGKDIEETILAITGQTNLKRNAYEPENKITYDTEDKYIPNQRFNQEIKTRFNGLKTGFTTGTCAAIAAKAATEMLLSGETVLSESLVTPGGERVEVNIEDIKITHDIVKCAVKKDAGDDPDVTNGVLVYAEVSKIDKNEIIIDGGMGIGRVTKPGLACKVGEAAINPVPRQMIKEAVEQVLDGNFYEGGLKIIISVPDGIELAKKTFNPRLGIEGGISILGTSGIVVPMSEAALIDTIKVEMNVVRAQGNESLVIVPGNYGSDFVKESLGIDMNKAVVCSNYVGEAIDYACNIGFKQILLVGHIGKFIKVAAGAFNTHSHNVDTRMEVFAAHSALFGVDKQIISKVMQCVSTDEAIRILKESVDSDDFDEIMHSISDKMEFHISNRAIEARIAMIAFSNVHGIVCKTSLADELLELIDKA